MSLPRFPLNRIHLILAALALIVGVTGCADVVTYSKDAQREGLRLYAEGDYGNAAGAFRNSTRQNPRNYQGYYWLGASYEQLKQWQLALASYKTARSTLNLTIEGKYDREYREKILVGLGNAIAKADQRNLELDAAATEAEGSQNAESWFVVAKAYCFRGDADSAIDAFNRASILDPKSSMIWKHYGLYLDRIGQSDKAITPLRKAYAIDRTDTEVAEALRRAGVIPGPSLLEESQLAKPLVPKGPIPEVPLPRLPGSTPANEPSVAAPRD